MRVTSARDAVAAVRTTVVLLLYAGVGFPAVLYAVADTIGNFWVDVVRAVLFVLLPLSLVGGVGPIWQVCR